jgi:NAD(P)-dependent dehydrogenase (short-subunit alcohol dehydrogenase family)
MNAPVMLVVGGSGSIGGEIVAQAAAAGWQVAVHGRTEASVEAMRARTGFALVTGFPADLKMPGAVERLVESVGERLGRIDAVVDCMSTAPVGVIGPFDKTNPDAYLELAQVSIVHLQRLAHAALPWMESQGGTLICFASDAGRFAARHQAMIGASRAAIMGFTRNLALEVAQRQVTVHCISPSFVLESASARRLEAIDKSRFERAQKRAGLGLPTPADIAPLVLFLCGPGARRITGQVISVNGGLNA